MTIKWNCDLPESVVTEKCPTVGRQPRTAQDKNKVKYNAVQHGIFADLVLTGEPFRESLHDYKRLLAKLRKAIHPGNELEEVLTEQLAFEFLRMVRVYRADRQIVPRMFERLDKVLREDGPHLVTEVVDREREAIIILKDLDPELLLRYGASVSKQIHRLLDRIERLQRRHHGPEST